METAQDVLRQLETVDEQPDIAERLVDLVPACSARLRRGDGDEVVGSDASGATRSAAAPEELSSQQETKRAAQRAVWNPQAWRPASPSEQLDGRRIRQHAGQIRTAERRVAEVDGRDVGPQAGAVGRRARGGSPARGRPCGRRHLGGAVSGNTSLTAGTRPTLVPPTVEPWPAGEVVEAVVQVPQRAVATTSYAAS